MAEQTETSAAATLTAVALATRTPDCFADAADDDAIRSLGSELPARLARKVASHAARCRQVLTSP